MNQPTLFDARARYSDPVTSHEAAARQRGGLPGPILEAFRTYGPMTDDELCARLPEFYGPSIKTCRSRLSKAGGPLVPTDETRLSDRGFHQQVWKLA